MKKMIEKECAGCGNKIITETQLRDQEHLDWYIITAQSYCKECIRESPARELCLKELIKVAK